MFERKTIIVLISLVLSGLLQANIVKEPLRLVLLSGLYNQNWRLIISSVNEVDGDQYDIYPWVWVDTVAAEFKIKLKSKLPLQFVGDRTRFEGGADSLRIEIANIDEETLLIGGSLKQIRLIISHRISDRNMFIFDIYPYYLSIGDIAGAQSLLFNEITTDKGDSTYQAHIRQLLDDFNREKIAVNVSQTVRRTMFLKAIIFTSVIFAGLLIIKLNLSIIKFMKSRKNRAKKQNKKGKVSEHKEKAIRALMAEEGITYDEAEIKLNVGGG